MIFYGKKTFCSRKCQAEYKKSIPKTPVHYNCKNCGADMVAETKGKMHPYCSPSCAAFARHKNPEYRKKFLAIFQSEEVREKNSKIMTRNLLDPNSKLRQSVLKRMTEDNPSWNPETREKMASKLRGRTFLARGGNGTITVPQQKLAEALGWGMEYAIPCSKVPFPSPPKCYKVDIGNPDLKIAIEVDGNTHKMKKWKFLDARKTEILNYLGWSVLRFWNKEVNEDLNLCVEKVKQFIASKSKETTTSMQMVS
jgi:endogenous inhibitor of DNA gyrase (YacG/DUF329 family)